MRHRRPVRLAGMGQKNNDRVRIRNRRYKIKRFLAQPKNDVNRMVEQLEEWQLEDKQSIEAFDIGESIKSSINIKYLYRKSIFQLSKTFLQALNIYIGSLFQLSKY